MDLNGLGAVFYEYVHSQRNIRRLQHWPLVDGALVLTFGHPSGVCSVCLLVVAPTIADRFRDPGFNFGSGCCHSIISPLCQQKIKVNDYCEYTCGKRHRLSAEYRLCIGRGTDVCLLPRV